MMPPAAAPPTVPMVLPPVAADPTAPPTAAPPTVPTVSPRLPQPVMPRADASAIPTTKKILPMLFASGCKKRGPAKKVNRGSSATAEQENHEQHRNWHA